MSELRFDQVQPAGPEQVRRDWQQVHNLIIPTSPLSLDEVAGRAERNHLEVAYLDGVAVGCSTVRRGTPQWTPADDTVTVIARVLPDYRRRGFGEQVYQRCVATARELGARVIETVVLESNTDGLRFAEHHGFVEIDRYTLPGHTVAFVDLRLSER